MKSRLRHYRDDEGLNQADLTAVVGVSQQTINAIERERYDPSLELAFKLAAFFGCDIEELFIPEFDEMNEMD